nr:glycosyltransferase [Candidatus Sigynarchaeota archaeon]
MTGAKNRLKVLSISEIMLFKKLFKIDTVGGIEVNHKNLMAGLKRRGHIVLENIDYPPGTVPDILICPTYGPIALIKIWLKKKKYNCACVQHAHTTQEDMKGGFLPRPFLPYVKLYLKQLYKFSEVLITPSNFSRSTLLQLELPTRPPIVPISNGIDLNKFSFSQEKRDAFRSLLGTQFKRDTTKPVILGVGVIWERKGIDVFHYIAKKMPEFEFIWVGNIVTAKKLVAQYNNLPNLTFTGFVDDIVAAYCGA